jgi:putative transposase
VAADQKKTRRTKATLIFADESGFSLVPTRVCTWAPIGQTPVIVHRYAWPKLSAIGGVASNGRLFLLVRRGTIATQQVVVFLRHLLRHITGNVIVLFDNLNTHKSGAVKDFVAEHRDRLSIEYFPPYAPELNPAEWLWRHLKRVELANGAPKDIRDLRCNLGSAMVRIRKRPGLRRSFLAASALSF